MGWRDHIIPPSKPNFLKCAAVAVELIGGTFGIPLLVRSRKKSPRS